MPRLTFTTPFHGSLSGADVPVEIRTTSLALVKLASSRESVEVDAGTYVVKALFPAGQEIVRVVDVGQSQVVDLTPEEDEVSPRASLENATYAASPRAASSSWQVPKPEPELDVSAVLESLGPEMASASRGDNVLFVTPPRRMRGTTPSLPRAWMRCVEANALTGYCVIPAKQPVIEKSTDTMAVARVAPSQHTMLVQCMRPDKPVINIALPISGEAGCLIVIRREKDRYWIEPQLENPAASLLLGYRQNRAIAHEAHTAEQLLREKMVDPIAAVVGSYSLLSFGELDRLHDWTANLMNLMPWLPDGAAIRGEHLARLGQHREAIAALLATEARGLPIFSDGITMVYERLRMYLQMKKLEWDEAQRKAAQRMVEHLAGFISYVNFDQTITTFTGSDPTRPDDAPWKPPPRKSPGIAVHDVFK